MDKEFAIYMNLPHGGGKQELSTGAKTLEEAKKVAASWRVNNRATDITIKYYEDGNLMHQWEFINNQWKQYE